MLNYVAGLVLDVPDLRQPVVLARHVDVRGDRSSRRARPLPDGGDVAGSHVATRGDCVPLGFGVALGLAALVWVALLDGRGSASRCR